jgi:lipid-binding SYLF domain-containing protein
MFRITKTMGVLAIALLMAAGCSTAPKSSDARAELLDDVHDAIAMFKRSDPTIDRFFNSSVAYAVYPNIGKGGLVVGGAYGRGALFERGRFTSYCDMTQGTVGLQVGGQAYSEVIFFQNDGALNEFKNGALAFAAQASAVAVKSGAAANRDYDGGVAVFVGDQAGLMAEASIGGQKFSVVPASDAAFARDTRVNTNDNRDYSVYGYANEQDPAWRNDSDYNRQYDASQSRVIQGQVVAINDFSPARDAQKGRQLTIRSIDDQVYTVHLGPVAYLDRSDSVRIREGDRVTITGSPATFEGRQVIIARDITTSDNQRLELRDSDGRSRWNHNLNDKPLR